MAYPFMWFQPRFRRPSWLARLIRNTLEICKRLPLTRLSRQTSRTLSRSTSIKQVFLSARTFHSSMRWQGISWGWIYGLPGTIMASGISWATTALGSYSSTKPLCFTRHATLKSYTTNKLTPSKWLTRHLLAKTTLQFYLRRGSSKPWKTTLSISQTNSPNISTRSIGFWFVLDLSSSTWYRGTNRYQTISCSLKNSQAMDALC